MFFVSALAAFLASCAVGPDYRRPETPPVGSSLYVSGTLPERTAAVETSAGAAQTFLYGGELPIEWWRLFQSEKLNCLIAGAFAGNFTLDAARARLQQADANLRAVRGRLFPELEVQAGAIRQRVGSSSFAGDSASDGATDSTRRSSHSESSAFNIYTASAVVRYGIDIFGRARRAFEAQAARAELQRHELDAARLTVAGNIVSTVIRRAELRAQIEARQELIRAQEERLRIIEIQVNEGAAARATLASARADLALAQAPLPQLAQDFSEARQQLGLLIGMAPSLYEPAEISFDELRLPAELPVSLPSELVRRRPDIAAAESAVRAANAEIGFAQANLYPQITLDGAFGLGYSSAGGLSPAWNVASSVLAPVFDAGRRRGERDAASAAHRVAIAEYRQTILNAFVEVAGALRAIEHGAESLQARFAALSATRASLEIAELSFREGAVNYLEVLVARQQHQQAVLDYVSAVAARLQNSARLFASLGGMPGPQAPRRLPLAP